MEVGGGSLNNSYELSESTAGAFLIVDSHKYSEDMRCSRFEYVGNGVSSYRCCNLLRLSLADFVWLLIMGDLQDMVDPLHATPLFK
jgi:hypothetical protein